MLRGGSGRSRVVKLLRSLPPLRRQRGSLPRRAVLSLLRHPLQQAHDLGVLMVEGRPLGGGAAASSLSGCASTSRIAGGTCNPGAVRVRFPAVVAGSGGGGWGPLLLAPVGSGCLCGLAYAAAVRADLGSRRHVLLLLRAHVKHGRAGPQHPVGHGGRGRAWRRRSRLVVVGAGAAALVGGQVSAGRAAAVGAEAVVAAGAEADFVLVVNAVGVERDGGRQGAGASGRRGDGHDDAGRRSLRRAADGEEGGTLPAAEVGVLVGAALAALGDLAEAVQVELALEAGELVLLKEAAEHLRAQPSVVANLCWYYGRKAW